jgi:hypothetical protein
LVAKIGAIVRRFLTRCSSMSDENKIGHVNIHKQEQILIFRHNIDFAKAARQLFI